MVIQQKMVLLIKNIDYKPHLILLPCPRNSDEEQSMLHLISFLYFLNVLFLKVLEINLDCKSYEHHERVFVEFYHPFLNVFRELR